MAIWFNGFIVEWLNGFMVESMDSLMVGEECAAVTFSHGHQLFRKRAYLCSEGFKKNITFTYPFKNHNLANDTYT